MWRCLAIGFCILAESTHQLSELTTEQTNLLCIHIDGYIIKLSQFFLLDKRKIPQKTLAFYLLWKVFSHFMFALLASVDRYPQEKQSVGKRLTVIFHNVTRNQNVYGQWPWFRMEVRQTLALSLALMEKQSKLYTLMKNNNGPTLSP